MQLWSRPVDHPIRNLLILFAGWKAFLLLIATLSPGPGYDTSSSLNATSHTELKELPSLLRHVINKLTRWDALYFVSAANRGYLFEQEWAFGWGFTRVIAFCTSSLRKAGILHCGGLEALVGICIAHISHLLSVLVLFNLTLTVFPPSPSAIAFTAASLHVLSPAGLFLSAPYAESSCALLSFAGCLLFVKGAAKKGQTAAQDLFILASGVLFGVATTFRSNGVLNGLLLLEEAFRTLGHLKDGPQLATIRHLIATGMGGLCVAAGLLTPQYIAFSEYCGDLTRSRPWCQRTLPSIYTFVQDHYWNVGLFRYWTLSNLPLFLLAAPMLTILVKSALWAFNFNPNQIADMPTRVDKKAGIAHDTETFPILRNLAVQQLLLALLTMTTAHVQIVTRISSAFPVWLWYAAVPRKEKDSVLVGNLVRFMVIYSVIQGGLYASFLPPA